MNMSNKLVEVNEKYTARDYQEPIIEAIIKHCKESSEPAFVDISVGGGKCLAKNTPILMYDGSIKMVQDVVCGDKLMSHDSSPRTVTSTTTGSEMMYRVDQNRGEPYTVNESHILSFKVTNLGSKRITIKGKKYSSGDIVNLPVLDYLSLQKWKQRELKGWRPEQGVCFPNSENLLRIPPYIMGVWLGDGTSRRPEICSVDSEVINAWGGYAKSIGLTVNIIKQENRVNNYYITSGAKGKKNHLTSMLRHYDVLNNKHIPKDFLLASRSERLELLAGILDTDGYLSNGKTYDLVLKHKALAKGVEFLVRSLGMWCTARECKKTCTNTGATGTYYRMSIGGRTLEVPCKVERRKATEFNHHGIGRTGVKVTKVGNGNYYGFEISGNDKLFLLGDFTVTHNTGIYAFVAEHVAKKGGKVLVLARQGELVEQNANFAWKAHLKNSIYSASLKEKSTYYPVVYASEGTVSRQIKEHGDFGYTLNEDGSMNYTWVPDLLLIDENHQINYEDEDNQYMKIIRHFQRANKKLRIIGGTGSPFRGKKYIEGEFWKECLYRLSTEKLVEWGWLVPPIFGFPEDEGDGYDFSSIDVDKDNDNFSEEELDRITGDITKTHKIIKEIVERTKDRLGVLIFCSTKKHCQEAVQALPEGSYGIVSDSTSYEERSRIYKASRSGEIKYLVNVGVLSTGYNNPRIDTVCYLRPLDSLTLLIQTLGRGLRIPEDFDDFTKTNCLVLDYGDVFARLGDLYENPIMEDALAEKAKRKGDPIICPKCLVENSPFARRCVGKTPIFDVDIATGDKIFMGEERCDFFWSSRVCKDQVDNDGLLKVTGCGTENDPCARHCRKCDAQLIDPNEKLNGQHYTEKDLIDVVSTRFMGCKNGGILIIYKLANHQEAKEFFTPYGSNQLSRRFWRDGFMSQHIDKQSVLAFNNILKNRSMDKIQKAKAMCESGFIKAPIKMTHRLNDKGKSIINRKIFKDQ